MMIPLNDDTKQFVIDHWAELQPEDVGPFEPASVHFTRVGDTFTCFVACNSLTPPAVRAIEIDAAAIEALYQQVKAQAEAAAEEKPKRKRKPKSE